MKREGQGKTFDSESSRFTDKSQRAYLGWRARQDHRPGKINLKSAGDKYTKPANTYGR
jgi:hypothetical protein